MMGIAIMLTAAAIGSTIMTHEQNGNAGFLGETGGIPRASDLPILVSGDGGLAAASSSGNGTAANPYIIENKIIDAGGTGSAIQNTNAHFTIRNCTVFNSVSAFNNDEGGIKLYNVMNANVSGNNASNNNGNGIYVYGSNNTISGNIADNNADGIYMADGSNNTVSGNTASANTRFGIFLMTESQNNTISGNTASNNKAGIYSNGSNNTFSGNNVLNNTEMGFDLVGSNSTVSGNHASHNGRDGINVRGSRNMLSGNNASYNTWFGIEFASGANFNTISNNVLHYNARGCIGDAGSMNLKSDNDCIEYPPSIPGYETLLVSIVGLATIIAIVVKSKARRA
jgi:parallel beta-helix repeat protein